MTTYTLPLTAEDLATIRRAAHRERALAVSAFVRAIGGGFARLFAGKRAPHAGARPAGFAH